MPYSTVKPLVMKKTLQNNSRITRDGYVFMFLHYTLHTCRNSIEQRARVTRWLGIGLQTQKNSIFGHDDEEVHRI